jgi:ABC-type Fe3+/spermidine/putrescine transport system ATPase subunit
MQDPTAGMVSVNGVDISHESPHRRTFCLADGS